MPPNHVRVILNPQAGRGRGRQLKAQLLAALTAAGVAADLVETEAPHHAIELARQARQAGYDLLVAAGGDGTLSEVVNGLAQVTPENELVGRLAVIPIGSANDFADMVGCPRDLNAAARAIAAGITRRVDLGHATIQTRTATIQRYFDNNVGVGFEAWVTLESYQIKRLQGLPLYLMAALRALRTCPTPLVHARWETVDGAVHHWSQPTLLVSVGNSRRTGGGFFLTPHALLDDGALDVGLAAAISRWRILWLLPKALFGRHTSDPAVTMARCRQLQLTSEGPLPVHVDGEVLTAAAERIEVVVQPGRLEVVVGRAPDSDS